MGKVDFLARLERVHYYAYRKRNPNREINEFYETLNITLIIFVFARTLERLFYPS